MPFFVVSEYVVVTGRSIYIAAGSSWTTRRIECGKKSEFLQFPYHQKLCELNSDGVRWWSYFNSLMNILHLRLWECMSGWWLILLLHEKYSICRALFREPAETDNQPFDLCVVVTSETYNIYVPCVIIRGSMKCTLNEIFIAEYVWCRIVVIVIHDPSVLRIKLLLIL